MKSSVAILLLAVSVFGQGGRRPQAAAPAVGTASIAGKVLDPSSGAPVRRAVVTVEGETRDVRTAKGVTDDEGVFVIRDLPKGKYWITAEKTGYLRGAYRGRTVGGYGDPVELGDGASKTGVDIVLAKQGVIAGRVVDEAGEPVERVAVQAIPMRKVAGRGGISNATMTNDLGEFRLSKLAPGSYKLLATRGMDRGEMLVEKAGGRATTEAPTYFPGTVEAASASPVRVNAGEERTGAEIRLQRSPVVMVSGRVSGDLPPANRGARVSLRPSGEAGVFRGPMMGGGSEGAIGADGSFFFRNVRPGEYVLTVTAMDKGGPKTMAKQPVVVGQTDVTGLAVAAAAPPKIDGRVRADGEPPFAFGKVSITLQPAAGGPMYGPPSSAESDDTGLFSFPSVSRDKMTLNVRTQSGVIVKGIYAGGQLLPGLEIDFSVVSGPLEIVLSNKPSSVTGTVEGTSPDAPRVAVWLVPDTQPFAIEAWSTKKVRVQSDSPSFSFDSLRPGSYRVAAFEEAESDALNDAGFWEQFKDRIGVVKIGEGETGQVKVRLIGSKEMEGN